MKSLRKITVTGAMLLAATSLSLVGCTSADIQATSAAVQALCATAVVGTTIYVNVESNLGGATAQKISQTVGSSTSTACTSLDSAVQAAVQAITAAGGTATVSVTQQAPAAAAKLIAKLKIKGVGEKRSVEFVVKPNVPFSLFGLGAL